MWYSLFYGITALTLISSTSAQASASDLGVDFAPEPTNSNDAAQQASQNAGILESALWTQHNTPTVQRSLALYMAQVTNSSSSRLMSECLSPPQALPPTNTFPLPS